jgi:hypothetical protein
MAARSFVWLAISGGAWTQAGNWDDITDATDPSVLAPGLADSVTVAGPSGAQIETITGPGAAYAAVFTGSTLLSGGFTFSGLTAGAQGEGGLLELAAGTDLAAGTAAIISGSAVVASSATLAVSGTLSLSAVPSSGIEPDPATLNVTGGGHASVLALLMNAPNDSIYVDPDSILEIGQAGVSGGGRAGTLTIDSGAVLAGQGSADAYGQVANNGTVAAQGGTLTLGTLSATGTLQIDAGATLALNGPTPATQGVAFAGGNATLAIDAEFYAPDGLITGLAAGDNIDFVGSPISSASFSGTAAGGTLTLFYGGQVAASLYLAGAYTNDLFLTASDGDGGTLVTLAPKASGGTAPSPGTATPDQYAWTAAGSGTWKTSANWQDISAGLSPAAIAPGIADLVSIAAPATSFDIIAGPADAGLLSVTGEVALTGAYAIGTLALGQAQGVTFTAGTLDLLSGASLSAQSASIAAGGLSVSGQSTTLMIAGTLSMGGGISGVGLPVTALSATAGAAIQMAGLVLGGGSGNSLTTDPTASIEIGKLGHAAPGAITIDAGAALSGNGAVNPLGTIVNNGIITASGGVLTLGTITGNGALDIANGGALDLWAATAEAITFASATGTASPTGTLAFADIRDAPTGAITNFDLGDAIDLAGSSLTGVQLNATGTNQGTLLLIYNNVVVGRLSIAGGFTGNHFAAVPDGEGGTYITLIANQGGLSGSGQSDTDPLSWTSPIDGAWQQPLKWTDLTTGKLASAPPGSLTAVQIAGPSGGIFQSLTGPGTSQSATFTGNTALAGNFSLGTLAVGAAASGTLAAIPAFLYLSGGSTVTATQGGIADGEILATGLGNSLMVTGTFALASVASLLVATAHAQVQIGDVALAGGTLSADIASSIEIGALGGAASGALTIDPGASVTGFGSLDVAGDIIDNGLIDAEGGELQLGTVSGGGSLTIGTEAVLALSNATTCAIAFAGGGAALTLSDAAQTLTTPLSGFVTGDAIITSDASLSGVTTALGPGGITTLTLLQDGVVTGQILLTGNYANDVFSVSPDGEGSEITVAPAIYTGPPRGTATPDVYIWTGTASGAWSTPANWQDSSAGQSPAAVAPGQFDSVQIDGGTGAITAITGPANAAALSVAGTVSLNGIFNLGALAVGAATYPATLGVSGGATLNLANGVILGGLAVSGGSLAASGTLTLGEDVDQTPGILTATGAATIGLGALLLTGAASAAATDASSSIEIGGAMGTAMGNIAVDPAGLLQGAGSVDAAAGIVDDGTIAASAGTLVLQPGPSAGISGSGTLLIAPNANLVLDGVAASGLTADFAGAGTLTIASLAANGVLGPAIADFGPSDSILLPVSGATSALYTVTGAGTGVLTIDGSGGVLAQITLLGGQNGAGYLVAAGPAGGTILTDIPGTTPVTKGEGTVSNNPTVDGGLQVLPVDLENDLAPILAAYAASDLAALLSDNPPTYEYFSVDGLTPDGNAFYTSGAGVNVEVVGPLASQTGGGGGPLGVITMQPGYSAVILEGNEPINLGDGAHGDALLIGNDGTDTISAGGNNDTLVGALGYNTTFFASLAAATPVGDCINVSIQGGGNDIMVIGNENAAITTSDDHSIVFLGSGLNQVQSNGNDEIICGGTGIASDTVSALTTGATGDLVFGPTEGELTFNGGNAPSTVVGNGGQLLVYGGAGNGGVVWAGNSPLEYIGGSGTAIIVTGSADDNLVQGGSAPISVFGGTGSGVYSGAPGSAFVVGEGASMVTAAPGDDIFIVGGAPVSVVGSGGGTNIYAGSSTGNDIFQAGAGNETLWGSAGDDSFFAGTGNDIMVGGAGTDSFGFLNGAAGGIDTIVGFNSAQDILALSGYGAQMPAISIAYGDSVLNLADGTQIIIEGVTNLTAANFTYS